MPVFVAYIKADLENVGSAAVDVATATLTIDVKQGQSDEMRESVTISREDEVPLDGSRGIANLVLSDWKASCSVLTADEFTTRFKKKKQALAETPRPVRRRMTGAAWVPRRRLRGAGSGRRARAAEGGRRVCKVGGGLPLRGRRPVGRRLGRL